jgi:hypothetical protein
MVVSFENGLEFSGFVDELSSTVIACNELDLSGTIRRGAESAAARFLEQRRGRQLQRFRKGGGRQNIRSERAKRACYLSDLNCNISVAVARRIIDSPPQEIKPSVEILGEATRKTYLCCQEQPLPPSSWTRPPGSNSEPHHTYFRSCHGIANIPWLETGPRFIGNLESLLRHAYRNLVDTFQAS